MNRTILTPLVGIAATTAFGQFVYPKPEYNEPQPGIYQEDPFIVKYRREFFGVFRGEVDRFDKAFFEIQEMVKKNPKDARALVWLGNGQTVKAGLLASKGKFAESKSFLIESRKTLDKAVSIRPEDPNIYMMRAATLYIQGQYWKGPQIPKENWEKIRDDCLKLEKLLGPNRIRKVSIHLRGELYGELGIAYKNLGEIKLAAKAFERILDLNPGTEYSERATKELTEIKSVTVQKKR